jgi:4-hydroxyproline epimerase
MIDGKHRRVRVIDSHTGGEPTRMIVTGGPDLGNGPLSERLQPMGIRL